MKNSHAALIATAIPLLLTSLPVSAGELPFNTPTTTHAQESAQILHQAARALYDSRSAVANRTSGGKQISNLWLFPTADANTVFARYNLISDEEATSGAGASATEHLTVLTVRGNRIVESRELTSPPAELASNEPARLDWTAAIGTGYAARNTVTSSGETNANANGSSVGVTASPHWTAGIGTGTAGATNTAPDTKQSLPSGTRPVVAAADWTSKIGTGHASDSTRQKMYASLANAR